MAATLLGVWNIACASVGERSLASTAEAREPQRLLNEVWTRGNGAEKFFLEQGLWNFAMKESSSTSASTGNFNFAYVHNVPTDFVRLAAISADPTFGFPLTRYEWYSSHIDADVTPIYLRYVSDSTSLGKDLSKWPDTFTLWAGHWLGTQIAPRLKNDIDREALRKETRDLLYDAQSKDASQEPTRWPPLSSWAQARLSGRGRGDRGNRGSLTG